MSSEKTCRFTSGTLQYILKRHLHCAAKADVYFGMHSAELRTSRMLIDQSMLIAFTDNLVRKRCKPDRLGTTHRLPHALFTSDADLQAG